MTQFEQMVLPKIPHNLFGQSFQAHLVSIVNVLPVTKNRAHLFTYSRKMKMSFPINQNLSQTWLFHKYFGCFVCYCLCCFLWVTLKRSVILVLTVAKNVNFKSRGDEFFMSYILLTSSNNQISEFRIPNILFTCLINSRARHSAIYKLKSRNLF